jgi:regulator of cell morphogenesis and NO signaling
MIVAEWTLAQLVLEHPAAARVLQRRRIDFACEGDRTVGEAALAHGIDVATLMRELRRAPDARHALERPDPRALPADALLEHLTSRVHHELRNRLRFTSSLAHAVAEEDGARNGRLRALAEAVSRLHAELEAHMDGEEAILFPAIRAGGSQRAVVEDALLGMHDEHLFVGALLARTREAAEDFRVRRWASRAYRKLFDELDELEYDVLCHMHLENHVLLPRALS